MSIRERLRKSSSIQEPFTPSSLSAGENSDGRCVTAITLSCDDVSTEGDVHREFRLVRGMHRTVDFFRTSSANSTGRMYVAAGGAARAAFSSPVMSRRHARITLAQDGSVTIMDLGSMHGTYLGGADFDDPLPEKLKPRRHYTLRSGDNILLGKPVNRDERDWRPVAIRVNFMHDAGASFATPPPNRYGLFIDPTGGSDTDTDAYSISSSSCGEEVDGQSQTGTSPASSPAVSHVPLQLDGVISASASLENLSSSRRVADDAIPVPGVFDLNRTVSASGALRAILPPIPNIQSAIRRLPSLRELGFFSGTNSTCGSTVEQSMVNVGDDIQASVDDPNIDAGELDVTASAPNSFGPSCTSQPSIPHVDSQAASTEDDGSCSMFPWQEPSHPQNQLGLELTEPAEFHEELRDSKCQEDEHQNSGLESDHAPPLASAVTAREKTEAKAGDEDDVKSMEISPTSSRCASPSFHATGMFHEFDRTDESRSTSRGLDENSYCRCHEVEGHPQEDNQENKQIKEQIILQPDVEAGTLAPAPVPMAITSVSMSMPTTPENRRWVSNLTAPTSATDLHSLRRRAKDTRLSFAYGPIPSPVSIGKRGKRIGARLGPTRLSPTPNPPGPFGRMGRLHADKACISRYPPQVDALRAKVRALESRMKEVQDSAIMMSSVASASATASTSSSAASIDEARKEMDSMREEMRRLSGLIETLVTKMETRTSTSDQPSEQPIHTTVPKRKRLDDLDDLCTLGELEASLDLQMQQPFTMRERHHSFHEPGVEPDVRPAKRARVGGITERRAVTTVAAAAGYTSLGAALAWVMLAYVL